VGSPSSLKEKEEATFLGGNFNLLQTRRRIFAYQLKEKHIN